MEFKHIEYFIETCNHKSISQAAESLYISQQALSRCIANIEAELGCTIFHRTVKGISLTEEGKYLYERFNPLVMEFRNTLSQTISYFEHKPKKLSFACAPFIFRVLGPELLLSFQTYLLIKFYVFDKKGLKYVRTYKRFRSGSHRSHVERKQETNVYSLRKSFLCRGV